MQSKIKYKYTAIATHNLDEIHLLSRKLKKEFFGEGKDDIIMNCITYLLFLHNREASTPPYILLYNHKSDKLLTLSSKVLNELPYYKPHIRCLETVYNYKIFEPKFSYSHKKL